MKVLTFGEIMLRLKAPGAERLFQTPVLEATFGGGELTPSLLWTSKAWMCSSSPSSRIILSAQLA